MNKNITVAIWMICYNQENYIAQAIESVLKQQTDFHFKLFIADDCSTDNTTAICTDFAKRYPDKIDFLSQDRNVGAIANAQDNYRRCYESGAKYMALLEGDDYWTDNEKLKKQIRFLEDNQDYVVCFHPCYFLNDKTGELIPQSIDTIAYDYTFENLLKFWSIPTASMIYRLTDVFENFPDWIYNVPSGDIAVTILNFEKGKFKLLNEHMSVYRRHDAGFSSSHRGSRMIHYRSYLYYKLNDYFNYKYEESIYNALHHLMLVFMPHLNTDTKEQKASELISKLKNKVIKKIK